MSPYYPPSGGGSAAGGISFQFPSAPGSINLGSSNYISIYSSGLPGLTNVTLYTVPTGKRAAFLGAVFTNTGGVAIDFYIRFLIGGTYYDSSRITAVSPNGTGNFSSINYIGEAGESLVIFCSAAGFLPYAKVVEFGTDTLLRSYKNTAISSGNNVIYTASNNVVGMSLNSDLNNGGTASQTYYANGMSGSSLIQFSLVKSGNVVAGNNFSIAGSASVSSLARTTIISNFAITSGDYISLYCNTGASPQIAWVNVMEM